MKLTQAERALIFFSEQAHIRAVRTRKQIKKRQRAEARAEMWKNIRNRGNGGNNGSAQS